MKKLFSAILLASSLTAYAESNTQNSHSILPDIFIPQDTHLVEAAIDIVLTSDKKVFEIATAIQTATRDTDWVIVYTDIAPEEAMIELAKLGADKTPESTEAYVMYDIFSRDGKTVIEMSYEKPVLATAEKEAVEKPKTEEKANTPVKRK